VPNTIPIAEQTVGSIDELGFAKGVDDAKLETEGTELEVPALAVDKSGPNVLTIVVVAVAMVVVLEFRSLRVVSSAYN
jgi:hypothetical protein